MKYKHTAVTTLHQIIPHHARLIVTKCQILLLIVIYWVSYERWEEMDGVEEEDKLQLHPCLSNMSSNCHHCILLDMCVKLS